MLKNSSAIKHLIETSNGAGKRRGGSREIQGRRRRRRRETCLQYYIDERNVKAWTKITHQCIPWIQNRYVLVLAILYSFEGFNKTLSAWLILFCAERFTSVVCLLPIILRRDNCAFIDYFKRLANERFHSF